MEASEEAVLIIRDPITPESGSVELLFSGALAQKSMDKWAQQ